MSLSLIGDAAPDVVLGGQIAPTITIDKVEDDIFKEYTYQWEI